MLMCNSQWNWWTLILGYLAPLEQALRTGRVFQNNGRILTLKIQFPLPKLQSRYQRWLQ